MALRQIRIGGNSNIIQYDDAAYSSAVETDQPIKAGTPADPNDVLRLQDLTAWTSGKVWFTTTGGVAVKLTNKTGGDSVKGEVVTPSSTVDNAVSKIVVDVPDPIGVFYESGIADGSEAWVVVAGIADVYFIGSTTRGYIARGFLAADAGYVIGQAMAEIYPTSPFSVDKHFYEIGHVLESRVGAGLAKCVLHFN